MSAVLKARQFFGNPFVFLALKSKMSEPSPVTQKELELAQEVILRAHAAGVIKPEDPWGGAMNDSSKRLREGLGYEEWEEIIDEQRTLTEERMEHVSKQAQLPLKPTKDKDINKSVSLPPGVSSVNDWGNTVCRLPRVAKMECSYSELLEKPELFSYLKWVKQHGKGQSGRFEDFSKYLTAVRFGETSGSSSGYVESECFPGSSDRRERK